MTSNNYGVRKSRLVQVMHGVNVMLRLFSLSFFIPIILLDPVDRALFWWQRFVRAFTDPEGIYRQSKTPLGLPHGLFFYPTPRNCVYPPIGLQHELAWPWHHLLAPWITAGKTYFLTLVTTADLRTFIANVYRMFFCLKSQRIIVFSVHYAVQWGGRSLV